MFKVDECRVPPHSEFLRNGVVAALDELDSLPLCVVVDVFELLKDLLAFVTIHLVLI